MRHKWTAEEIGIVRANKNLSAAVIKDRFFTTKADVTVKGIQRKKDQMRGENLLRNSVPIEKWELDFIEKNLDMKNSKLSDILQRKPDKIDQMRLTVRKRLGLKKTGTIRIERPKKAVKEKQPTLELAMVMSRSDVKNALAAVEFIKNMPQGVIDCLSDNRKENKDHYELVTLHEYFRVPQSRHLDKHSSPRKLMTLLRKKTQHYNRTLRNISKEKSANVSTYQWNILRIICGIRQTSWKNLIIHNDKDSSNNKNELRAVTLAMTEYLDSPGSLRKAKRARKPIRKNGLN